MSLSLSAEQKTVRGVFNIEEVYIIPQYQRPYSWEIEECLLLWEDIHMSLKNQDNEDGYFLGNIVIAKSKDYLEVIDGQQRLITLTLFLKALSYFDIDNWHIKEAIWIFDSRNRTKKKQRVQSRVWESKDDVSLSACLEIEDKNLVEQKCQEKSKNRFERNLCFFYEKIKKEFPDTSTELSNYLLGSVYLLPISSQDSDAVRAREKAITIFETINNRGLVLSDADIFKAILYTSALNKEKDEDFISRWKAITEKSNEFNQGLTDIFRIYSHVIRGRKNDTDTEVGLRQFFTLKKHHPLKNENYDQVLNDIEKIIRIIEFEKRSIEGFEDLTVEKANVTKWLQLINAYTNQFPKYAVYVYLFQHDEIINNFPTGANAFISFLKNVIRYCYFQGSTSTIKFEIFRIIVDISMNRTYEFKSEKISPTNFESLGRLKNAFVMLASYLDYSQKPVYPYYIDRIVNSSDKDLLNESWNNIEESIYLDNLGNLILSDLPKTRKNIINKVSIYERSEMQELNSIALKITDWSYADYTERQEKLIKRLIDFFSGNENENT
jgi:uncharacterized protein with ParB-like and HNH nuclease domain